MCDELETVNNEPENVKMRMQVKAVDLMKMLRYGSGIHGNGRT